MSSPKGASTRWIFVCLTHVLTLLLETLGSPLLADHYRAFPEIGASLDLSSRLLQSTSGWSEVSGWTDTQLSDSGRFLFGAPLVTKASRFQIPKSGIYFVSFSVHLSQADIGLFQAALVINGQTDQRNEAMSAVRQGYQSGDFSLVVSGFVDLRSSDEISVFAFSEKDTDWSVEDDSQFTLRYTGPVGSFPAFSAIKSTAMTTGSPSSSHVVRNWDTSGTPGTFVSLTGFSPSTGEFVAICEGIYFLAANIRVRANRGLQKLYLTVNGEIRGPFIDVETASSESVFTMNLHGSLYLKTGDKLTLLIDSSSSAGVAIHLDSGFSVSYIDAFNQSSLQGVSTLTQTTTEIPGTGWMELTTWPTPLIAHVQFYNPEVFHHGRFTCSQGGIYYVAVSLRIRGGRGNFDLLVKSSGTSQLTGNAGLYATQYNPESSGCFSLSVSGLLELSRGQHVSVFVHSSFPDKWLIEPGSGLSLMKTRHYWPAANSYLSTNQVFTGDKWEEIGGWKQSGEEGAFSFGTNFRSSSSHFSVSTPGVYLVSTNLLIHAKNTRISAVISVDQRATEENGLYATHAYPPDNLTLNIAGSLNLDQGQNISVYVRSDSNDSLKVLERSGFSAVFIGKSFAVLGFHTVKGSQSPIRTTNWVEIDGWVKPDNEGEDTFQNGGGFDNVRGTYTAPISGIYFVSCMLVIKDVDVDTFGSYIEVYIGVNGQASLTNGLQNTRYIQGMDPPSGNDVMTITVSGMVQLRRGDYAVIRARTNTDFDWKVEGTSGFSMFLVSPSDISYGNVGFLSRKSDTRIKSLGPGSWSKIGGWATQSDLTNGLFLKNDGSFTYEALSGDLNINHGGIYFVSTNIIVSNIPESCEVSVLVSDSSGNDPQEVVTGFTSIEQKPQSNSKQTLQFTGALFLKKNRKIHVAARSGSADPFTVWEGSGFSVARLIYPIEEPGFFSRISGALQPSGQSSWAKITGWETSGGTGLHLDGHGFNSMTGNFIVPLSGFYLASASVSLGDVSHAGIISVKISVNGDTSENSGLESSHLGKRGFHAVALASGSMELMQGMTVSVLVRSDNSSSFNLTVGSYFTMRYISERERAEGNMVDRYSDVIFTSSGWKELVSWKTAGLNGQFQVGSIHQTTDRFGVSISGVYYVTANIQLLETNGLAIVGIVINSGNDTAVVAEKTCVTSEVCSLNLATSVELAAGTFASVYIYSDDEDRWIVSSQSSKSNLYLHPVPPSTVVQGFLARVSTNLSVSVRLISDWFRVRNWTTTAHPGYFQTIAGFSGDGVFVVDNAGVYIATVNLILQCTGIQKCDFEMLVAFNGRLSPSSGLYSRQTVPAMSIDTLTITTVAQLFRWDTLAVAVRSDSSFQVLKDSSFSVVMHASAGGPYLCSNNGPTLTQELSPAYLRTRVGSSVTWSCEAVGETSPQYHWLKNYEVLSNVSSNSLTVTNATVQDSGDYVCVAKGSPVSVSSNIARFIVYDPRPAFEPLNYSVFVKENGPALQLILNVPVRSESKEKTRADMLFRIISGNMNDSFLLMPNISSHHFGIFTTRPLDREDISEYQLLVEAVNIDEHALNSTTAVNISVLDVNDNAPFFNNKINHVDILENATLGHVVLVLNAQDDDTGLNANVRFMVLAGSGLKTFSLNKTSGEITLVKSLDRETQPSYSLFIAARDPDFTAFSEVVITVLDVNEHKPVFNPLKYNVTISEAAVIGTSLLKLSATDQDAGKNSHLEYSIVSGDPRGLFAVNSDGIITVAKDLDHEKNSTHNIAVTVHDKGETQLFAKQPAHVFILVRDLNDNSPVFEVSLYEETISESTPPGTLVLRVRAMDADRSLANSKMVFFMVKEDLDHDFKLNSSSGAIYVNNSLDFERTKVYRFQVAVRDISMDSRMDVTTVVISISDENDNSPVFQPTHYNISISEATVVGKELLRLHASDIDSTSNAALNFFIESGNENSTFFLDESAGFLFLASEVDHENVTHYRLIISVIDKGTPPRKAKVSSTVDIEVYDDNDNAPRFDSEAYTIAVYENITSGTYLCTVHAEDKDSQLNQELTYFMASYSEPKAKQKFKVNATTGEIFTQEDLDREEQEVYEFTVVARDGGKVPLESYSKVTVTLIDINDNNPIFEPAEYQVTVSEHAPVQTTIKIVHATDSDKTTNGRVAYSITSGNLNDTFAVTEDGAIYTTKKLDYERVTGYILTVMTTDLGSPSRSALAPAIVNITVDDSNDNEPVFDEVVYTTVTYENATIGESVLQIWARDEDSGKNGEISYSIAPHHTLAREVFYINVTTGEISVKSALDYERNTIHSFTVTATDAGEQSMSGLTWVNIYVYDVNDNHPVFGPVTYERNVTEASPIGTTVLRVQANDNDTGTNSRLHYNILSGNENCTFLVDADGTVILQKKIDYETQKFLNLTIRAEDGGNPPKFSSPDAELKITVQDENDNSPKFELSSYTVKVYENITVGTGLLNVTASDADSGNNGELRYSIMDERIKRTFNINSSTGEIKTISQLDREKVQSYKFTVVVFDHGNVPFSDFTNIEIEVLDINDQPPEFVPNLYEITVSEAALPRTIILKLTSRDNDSSSNAKLSFQITSGNVNSLFNVSADGAVILNSFLNRESRSQFNLTIEAQDQGEPPLVSNPPASVYISIHDANDNQPVFDLSLYSASIPENTSIGTSVLQVHAFDMDNGVNNLLTYALNSSEVTKFSIDSSSGVLTTAEGLDYEDENFFTFSVFAFDGGRQPKTSSCRVEILITDINDNKPVFISAVYHVNITEASLPGSVVAVVTALDNDSSSNAFLTYSIVSRNLFNAFMIDENGILKLEKELDFESITEYNLTISAHDNGLTQLSTENPATVVIKVTDANDNTPVFNQSLYTASIFENVTVNSEVLRVFASDRDSGDNKLIRFEISDREMETYFKVDEQSGLLTTNTTLDFEQQTTFELTVVATDRGKAPRAGSARVRVHIMDINDNPPTFYPQSYNITVTEGTLPGTVLSRVYATDNDYATNSQVTYEITSSHSDTFHVDDSGRITLIKHVDFEVTKFYNVVITATDHGFPKLASSPPAFVFINIADMNDNSPEFNASFYESVISENITSGDHILTVIARDLDIGTNGELLYAINAHDSNLPFFISEESGAIYSNESFDHESLAEYSFTVVVHDRGSPPRTSKVNVRIYVTDINDNPPIFYPVHYVTSLSEAVSIGTTVTFVQASDADAGLNGRLSFAIAQGNINGVFEIDHDRGIITVNKSMDYEKIKEYNLTISASDSGLPRLSSQGFADVRVIVVDANDNAPKFNRSHYEVAVAENFTLGESFLEVHAYDFDSDLNGNILYSIKSSFVVQRQFSIDNVTGVLQLVQPLDFEKGREHFLTVVARDQGDLKRVDTAHVHVTVLDVNDNRPRFLSRYYHVNVSEATEIGTIIQRIPAFDNDSNLNAKLRFTVAGGNDLHFFAIDKDTGDISTTQVLDRETIADFVLTISLADLGSPSLNAINNATVRITITDINDNAPQFYQQFHNASVIENSAVGSTIFTVQAYDADYGINREIIYLIADDTLEDKFSVHNKTGELSLRKSLDFEEKSQYEFNIFAKDEGDGNHVGYCTVLIVVVDMNDNNPVFEPVFYAAILSESTEVGNIVAHVAANDRDSTTNAQISYAIEEGNTDDIFHINDAGFITLQRPLDREQVECFNLSLLAWDNGIPKRNSSNKARVQIQVLDENDNSPVFNQSYYKVVVRENGSMLEYVITVFANDLDSGTNGDVIYSITTAAATETFAVENTTGVIVTTTSLDYEHQTSYDFVVTAKDRGLSPRTANTHVHVEVSDRNDNRPEFMPQEYHLEISEATTVSNIITKLHAVDKDSNSNSKLTFAITAGNEEASFRINDLSGEISIAKPLDRERTEQYNLTVTAWDGGSPPLQVQSPARVKIVVLDENDNRPIFERPFYSATVSEDIAVGSIVLRVNASDMDANTAIRFSLDDSSGIMKTFGINNEKGQITLLNLLDFEEKQEYRFSVIAEDMADRSSHLSAAPVEIYVTDVNDNFPTFEHHLHEVELSEMANIGRLVTILSANDLDSPANSMLNFSIIDGNSENVFIINDKGFIFLNKDLDYEQRSFHRLVVQVSDNGDPMLFSPTKAVVEITVVDFNDNSPEFTRNHYEVVLFENATTGSVLLQIEAHDNDSYKNGEIQYSLLTADLSQDIKIENTTGEIKLTKQLDFESKSIYDFVVVARDQGIPSRMSTAQMYISVLDVNDNYPYFKPSEYTREISEFTDSGTIVLRVTANDRDSTTNAMLRFDLLDGNIGGVFSLDQSEGAVIVNTELDRETTPEFNLSITVTDSGAPPLTARLPAKVRVVIRDENDCRPEFENSSYVAYISENATVHDVVLDVHATDKDEGTNGEVFYYLKDPTVLETFHLDNSTGVISIANELDYEKRRSYEFNIYAKDRGKPALHSSASVNIVVRDVNDNAPYFEPEEYRVNISELSRVGTVVTFVTAIDPDKRSDISLNYSIRDGDETSKFSITDKAVILVKDSLDFEQTSYFNLTIDVQDNGIPFRKAANPATVQITLYDENDNAPKFHRNYTERRFHENFTSSLQLTADAPITSAVITLNAVDQDTGLGGKITYAILDIAGSILSQHNEANHCANDSYGTFRIDEHTGTLRVARSLAARCRYNVTVRAMDHGIPPLFSVISIEIETGNRNATEFRGPTTTAVVSQEDYTKVIIIVCVFILIIALIIALVIWREARRHMRKKSVMVTRSIRGGTKIAEDSYSSDENDRGRFISYPMDHHGTYLDHCSTTTEMPSSLQTPRSLCSFGMETDILETFTVPYDGKEGYTVLDGDTESFCVSIDFGLESDDPLVFPVTTTTVNARKVTRRKSAPRDESRSLVSSSGSKRSQASLPANLGSRNYPKRNSVREVISDTRL